MMVLDDCLVDRVRVAHREVSAINPEIAFLICHSKHDTMCDPEGSQQLMNELKGQRI